MTAKLVSSGGNKVRWVTSACGENPGMDVKQMFGKLMNTLFGDVDNKMVGVVMDLDDEDDDDVMVWMVEDDDTIAVVVVVVLLLLPNPR